MRPRPFTLSILALLLAAGGQEVRAQTAPAPAAPTEAPVASPSAPSGASQPSSDTVFNQAELEKLLKPIALYPDVLLAQLLPASAYPLEIVQAARWLDRNKAAVQKGDYSAADALNWDSSAILDARVAATKFALQMTPDQMKLWPPVEEAIRARAAARHARISKLQAGQLGDANLTDLVRKRGDNLIQRGESLKKLADAWQPLAATLSEDQKHRLAVLTLFVLREAREMLPRRDSSVEIWDEDDED